MAFEIQDYYDLVRLLYQHPEWQEELRNILISKDIRELPQLVRELTEAHKRSEARLSGVEE
ncbi:MAG: hypothetical protein RMJ85_05810, partial [Anaerolineales bacterium]|nr:hypothetical protein [Anaerolineales bacterium]